MLETMNHIRNMDQVTSRPTQLIVVNKQETLKYFGDTFIFRRHFLIIQITSNLLIYYKFQMSSFLHKLKVTARRKASKARIFFDQTTEILQQKCLELKQKIRAGANYLKNKIIELIERLKRWFQQNRWRILQGALQGAIIGGGIALTLIGIIFAIGFLPSGVLAGSLAASYMSAFGPITSGSLFAILQSITATGVIFWSVPLMSLVGALISALKTIIDSIQFDKLERINDPL